MPNAQTKAGRPGQDRPDEKSAARWTLPWLSQWAKAPRAHEVRRAALTPPSLDEAQNASEEIVALSRGEPTRAFDLSEVFVQLTRVDGGATHAIARRCRAHMFRRLGRYREALRDYAAALAGFDRLGSAIESARTAIGMVDALGHMGRDGEAHRLAMRARRVFVRAGEAGRAARLDVNVGLIAERSGKPTEALQAYRRAAGIFEKQSAASDLAMARFNEGNALVSLDRYDEALELYRASAETWRARGATTTLGRCQLAIGSVLFRLGRLDEAMAILEETSEMVAGLDDSELAATAALDQARAEILIDRLEPVRARLDAAIEGFKAIAMHADQAESFGLRASLRFKLGDVDGALGDWGRASEIYRGIGHESGRAWADFRGAEALARLGRGTESRARLRAALRTLQRSGAALEEMEARLLLAELEIERRPREAARQLALVARRLKGVRDPWIEYRVAMTKALLAKRGHDARGAEAALERAYSIARRLQALVPYESLQARWLGRRDELFRLALDPDLTPDAGRQFLWSERARAPRDAADAGAAVGPGVGAADRDAEGFEKAREELHWLDAQERARRFAETDKERPAADARALTAWRRKRTRVMTRLERHSKRLELRAARDRGRGVYAEPDLAAIQQALAPDEALVEFFCAERDLRTFLVTRDGIGVETRTEGFDEAREASLRLRQLWDRYRLGAGFARRHEDTLHKTADLLLARLRELLLEPALPRVPRGVRRLVVSPHAWLRTVPFHAMLDGEWDVQYALSGASLARRAGAKNGAARGAGGERNEGRDAGALIVGLASEDAPGAEREAHAVAREHPGATVLLGADATPAAVRAAWPRANMIHVAAHGAVHAADPRLSGLQLTGGTWTVHDVRSVETRAELVVLSSCQSGETVLWGSDHQVGLLPALFEGAAGAAIVCLWPADDETASILMSAFHHELSSRRSFGEALQSARRAVRGVKPAPYYWAPFALYGVDRRGGGTIS